MHAGRPPQPLSTPCTVGPGRTLAMRDTENQTLYAKHQITTTNMPTVKRPDVIPIDQPTVSKQWRMFAWHKYVADNAWYNVGKCRKYTNTTITLSMSMSMSMSLSLSLSHRFYSHFPREPQLAGIIEVKDNGSGVDNRNFKLCKTSAKLQSNHQTNIQLYKDPMPCLSPNQQCQSTGGKTTTTLFTD